MKNRKITLIKLGIFLFGISILLFNCEKEEIELLDVKTKKELKLKTVSVEKAKSFFESYQKNKPTLFARGESDQLTLDPQWETTAQDSLNFTEALLTNTETYINREGNYTSKVFFIEVNDSIVSAIHSTFPETTFDNGSLKAGNIYFNDFEGNFLDAYRVTDGKVSHRLIPKENIQQANMFSFLFVFFQASSTTSCWSVDNLPFDGVFDKVVIYGTSSSGSNDGSSSSSSSTGHSYSLFFGNNTDDGSDPEDNDSPEGSNGGNTGGGGIQNCTNGKLINPATNQCECGENQVEDSSGNCITNPCAGGTKIYNKETGECNCPEGQKEDAKGECVDDKCETTKDDLKKMFPNASDADMTILAAVLNKYGKDFGIDTDIKLQHFLAQAGHETGGFKNGIGSEESLYYTTEERLKKVYKKYFWQNSTDTINKRNPKDYLKNSSKVANFVYKKRMGNGNETSKEGYKYRGRGIFQLTGKNNYTAFKNWYNKKYKPDLDFVASPELLKSDKTISILSALWFYKTQVMDKIKVDKNTTVKKVTKRINGGVNGLKDRKDKLTKAKSSIKCK